MLERKHRSINGGKYCQDLALLKIIAWNYKYRNSQDPIFISFSSEKTPHAFHSERQVGVGSFSEARGAGLIFLEDLFPSSGLRGSFQEGTPPHTHTPPTICVFTTGTKGSGYWIQLLGFPKFRVHENCLGHLFKMLIPGLYLQIF